MSLPVVLIADKLAESTVAALGDAVEVRWVDGPNREKLLAAVADADALLVRSATRVDAEVLAALAHILGEVPLLETDAVRAAEQFEQALELFATSTRRSSGPTCKRAPAPPSLQLGNAREESSGSSAHTERFGSSARARSGSRPPPSSKRWASPSTAASDALPPATSKTAG